MNLLILKFTIAPCLVALASLAGRRWGLKIGGAIGGFPVVLGPILYFFAVEQGPEFASRAALRSCWGLLPLSLFCLTFSWTMLRLSLFLSLGLGWAVFLLTSFLGLQFSFGPAATAAMVFPALLIARLFLPKKPLDHLPKGGLPSAWDIPARMLATLILVLSLTAAAARLGPDWSGALAPFPVASSILSVFAFVSDGPYGPGMLFKGSLLGFISYACFSLVLSFLLLHTGLKAAFGWALLTALLVQITSLSLSRKLE